MSKLKRYQVEVIETTAGEKRFGRALNEGSPSFISISKLHMKHKVFHGVRLYLRFIKVTA